MPRIIRTLPARADLRAIWLYIGQQSPEAADRLLDRFDQTMQMLAAEPELGEEQPQLRTGLRRFVVGNYLIFYESIDDGIRVIRVLHGARRYEDEF
jgi:toxin ParE1/3/4